MQKMFVFDTKPLNLILRCHFPFYIAVILLVKLQKTKITPDFSIQMATLISTIMRVAINFICLLVYLTKGVHIAFVNN